MAIPSAVTAEVWCPAKGFAINGYIYGMPALEGIRLVDGRPMANVSLCGQECGDPSTQQRLSIALTAQARGATLNLYFGDIDSCESVQAYAKPYGMQIRP